MVWCFSATSEGSGCQRAAAGEKEKVGAGNRGCGGRFVSRITYCLSRCASCDIWRGGLAVAGVDWADSSWGQVIRRCRSRAQWRSTPRSADVELVGSCRCRVTCSPRAANVHYGRMALNNITTPFFWTTCFFFIVRGLRRRSLADWTLAGLAAGVSEHFYYGTRLLPFILIAFIVYLLVVHWTEARDYVTHIGALVLGYLIGFGPLLSYFMTHRGLYYGRGASLMTWNHIPTSWQDLQKMWNTLWPIMSDNLLGISTRSAQD